LKTSAARRGARRASVSDPPGTEPCPRRVLACHNRQRSRRIATERLRRIIKTLLDESLEITDYELSVCLVSTPEITRLNETFLNHEGATDVITFDYSERSRPKRLSGEIFVCVEQAASQARQFRTTWQSEIVRYIVHGVLHLCGFDDHAPAARRRMKLAESRLLRQLARRLDFRQVGDH